MRRLFAGMRCCIPERDQKERTLLLDSDGIVRWVNLTGNIAVRARPEQMLEASNQLKSAGE